MKVEAIISEVARIREHFKGMNKRTQFPLELKRQIIDYVYNGEPESGARAIEVGIIPTSVFKWRQAENGIVNARTVSHGKRGIRYAISTKIEAAEQVLKHGTNITSVSNSLGLANGTLGSWIKDYQAGLYNLENVVQVSRKKFKSYEILLSEVKSIEDELRNKKEEAKDALDREYEANIAKLKG